MEMVRRKFRIPAYAFMLFASFILASVFAWAFFAVDDQLEPKLAALYAGFASAFLVAFVQLGTSILEARKLYHYESMGVSEILEERRGNKYYSDLISKSRREILVIGVTASRFMQDFGSLKNENTGALVAALARNVDVKILLPTMQNLSVPDQGRLENTTVPIYAELKEKYKNLEIRSFDHIPAHSLVVVDDVCIAGPVFTDLESKFTPAIVLERSSRFASSYLKYFDSEWNSSEELQYGNNS